MKFFCYVLIILNKAMIHLYLRQSKFSNDRSYNNVYD